MTETLDPPQTLNLEYKELMDRADLLEAPIPNMPYDYQPHAPSGLLFVTQAAQRLRDSAGDIGYMIKLAQLEWRDLAKSLRDAAKAYEEVDEGAGESITNGTSMSVAVTPGVSDAELDAFMLTAADTSQAIEDQPCYSYYDVRQAAYEIVEPDQGAGFDSFAQQWTTYALALQEVTKRFLPFEYWEGTSALLAEANMQEHRNWLFRVADLCTMIAGQATDVASAQRVAVPPHPTVAEIEKCDDLWILYQTDEDYIPYWPETKPILEQNYKNMQDRCDVVLSEFKRQASLPLRAAEVSPPPKAVALPEPSTGGGGGETGDGSDDDMEDFPEITDDVPVEDPEDEWSPSGGSGTSGGSPTTTPDTLDDSELDELPLPPVTAVPASPNGGGVKPASFGGGIGGGVPSMPLQPRMGSESAPVTAAPAAAAQPGVGAGGRAPIGAGGMGMPMGGLGGAQNQNNNKPKRAQHEDEALYKEDRVWTASVIGNRRRNDTPVSP